MRRAPFSLLALATAACSSQATTASTVVAPPAEHPSGAESAPTASGAPALVRAREAPTVPVCAADEPVSLAALADNAPAHAAVARGAPGGMVAFVTDANHDGAAELVLQPLDAQGARRGNAVTVSTGPAPDFPALAADGDRFLLAYREGEGSAQRIVTRPVSADGTVSGPLARLSFPAGTFGPPALLATRSDRFVAAAMASSPPADPDALRAERLEIAGDARGARTVSPPDGARWDATVPPLLTRDGDGVRAFALATAAPPGGGGGGAYDDERVLFESVDTAAGGLRAVARDVDRPAALGALLAWRARLAPNESGARAYVFPREGGEQAPAPPVTLSAYRGAFDLPVALAPLGANLVGAFSLSQMSDGDAASVDLSLLTPAGEFVGRRPSVTSAPVRGVHFAVAGSPEGVDGASGAWVVLEQRDDHGGAALSLTRVSCDPGRAVDRLDVPPPTVPQEPAAAGAAPMSLATPPAQGNASVCSGAPASTVVATHQSGGDDSAAGTSGALAALPGATVAFAVVRDASVSRVAVNRVDARGAAGTAQNTLEGATAVLAAAPVGAEAVAAVATGGATAGLALVFARDDNSAPASVAVPVAAPTSAVIAGEANALFVVGGTSASPADATLYQVPLRGRRPGAPVALAPLRPGDRVLDAARVPGGTAVLLARPDRLGGAVSAAYARLMIPDRPARNTRGRRAGDPFAAPLGYGGGSAVWLPGAGPQPYFVRNAGGVLRVALNAPAGLSDARPALETLPRGGAILARDRGAHPSGWMVVSTGVPAADQEIPSPLTLVGFGAQGRVAATVPVAPRGAADEPGPVEGMASLAASGNRVAVLYRRAESNGSLSWVVWQASCALPAAQQEAGH